MDSGVDITIIAQYGNNEQLLCGNEVSDAEYNEGIDTSLSESVELLEQLYHEQFEYTTKVNNSKQKCNHNKTSESDQKYSTFRKVITNDKEERKLPANYYKLDKTTILNVARLIGARSIPQYQDVIRGRKSVVISMGTSMSRDHWSRGILTKVRFVNAIKIYKLSDNENLNKARYKRVEKEYRIICHTRDGWAIDRGPYPLQYYKNILITSFIGSYEEPAVPLTSISPELCQDVYDTIIQEIRRFYQSQIVHGGLNGENILIWRKTPHYVGWSNAVWRNEPTAHKKLMKDCNFITKFFKDKNVTVLSVEELFMLVTRMNKISSDVLDVIYNKEPKPKRRGNPNRKRPVPTPDRNARFKNIS